MALTTKERVDRVVAVILNKVHGLAWYWFQFDLAEGVRGSTRAEDEEVLAKVRESDVGFGYEWAGDDGDLSPLLRAVLQTLREQPRIAQEIFRRIFDDNVITNESGAEHGILGDFNRKDRERREQRFRKLVGKGRCAKRSMVVAEGDSWFQYPSFGAGPLRHDFVRDIVDHLLDEDRYCLLSVAAGGDWLSNMLRTREYIPELSRIEPAAFLFSGGGNDLMGGGRVANMVRHPRRERDPNQDPVLDLLLPRQSSDPNFQPARYNNGVTLLGDEFFNFLNLVFIQYLLFFLNVTGSRQLEEMLIITQGYDYAIPTRPDRGIPLSPKKLVHRIEGSGDWLWRPLEEKQIPEDRKADVIYAMITEFNELLIRLVTRGGLDNVFHVDCRGLAGKDDWFDEIHLNSATFGKAAAAISQCIQDGLEWKAGRRPHPPKVHRAV